MMFQHILLPTDGSQLSRDTAERAVSFAKAANLKITALYARPSGPTSVEDVGRLVEPAVLGRMASGSEGKSKEYLGCLLYTSRCV